MGSKTRPLVVALIGVLVVAGVGITVAVKVHRSHLEAAKEDQVRSWGVGACLLLPADSEVNFIELQNVLQLEETDCATPHAAEVLAIGRPNDPGCVSSSFPYIAAHESLRTQGLNVTPHVRVCLGEDTAILNGANRNDLVGSILGQNAERVSQ